ncbi:GIN domain-containing protein [Aurantibacillus circumpalustris]|uniref:GIN domain-containing protein n=1 Tax=Aurantibacillus circumpalustris TaxID=3036359 RepID=UPI00295B4334|nr:DUF2807 domain-containing protein [Aurantibacillus circumpalustris]
MNKISILLVVLISSFISCHAQRSQERTISKFDKIKLSGAVNVIYTNSDTVGLIIKGKESDFDKIETKMENSTLIITSKGSFNSEMNIYIKNNGLVNIETSGAARLKTTNTLKSDSILFDVSGASDIHAKLETKKVSCFEVGASNLVLEGSADYMDAKISGAASLKSYNLIVKDAVLTTSGAASAKVNVTDKLNAVATSASDIKVKGDPKDVTVETSTAANITRIKSVSAKDGKNDGDTTYFNLKKRKILLIGNSEDSETKANDAVEEFKHWRGFSLGINGLMTSPGAVNIPSNYQYMEVVYKNSFNLQFNLIERNFNIIDNNFKIVTGFGFDYHSYELAKKTSLNADSSFTWGTIDSTDTYTYKKNRLRNTYIQVPLLLEFNTSNDPKKTFHIAFGVIGEFLISSRTKQVLTQGKDELTKVRKDNYNMTPFTAKAHVNLGYRGWMFFAEYNLTPLFQYGKGPDLYPFTGGIRVIPFS